MGIVGKEIHQARHGKYLTVEKWEHYDMDRQWEREKVTGSFPNISGDIICDSS